VILDDEALGWRFASGRRVAESLRALAEDMGATPLADYAWEVRDGEAVARHLRRVTPIGLIAVREDQPAPDGGAWSLRAQIVTLQQAVDIAIVRRESAGDSGFWELHVGDGNPRPVPDPELPAAFALVRAALEATARG